MERGPRRTKVAKRADLKMKEGTAAIKYVIEANGKRERPTEEDWGRIITFARIFGWVDALLVRRQFVVDEQHEPVTCQTKMLAELENDRLALKLALQFGIDSDLLSLAFCVNKTDDRWLVADFDVPLRFQANKIVRMLFYSPVEGATNFRVWRSDRSKGSLRV